MLEAHEPDADLLVAGLRYVSTRRVEDRIGDLYEILTTKRPVRDKKMIDEACLDAIVDTTDDDRDAARFLARACTGSRRLPSMASYEATLRRLGPVANDEILNALAAPELDRRRGRRLASLLIKVAKVPPPEPPSRWLRGDDAHRVEIVARWRTLVAEAGKLDLPEPVAGNDGEPDEGS